MTKKQIALKYSIAHWERMIQFARKCPIMDKPSILGMYDNLGEAWGSSDCALCRLYLPKSFMECPKCPLSTIGEQCDKSGTVWRDVALSETWKEWLIYANEMLVILKELLKRSK